MGLCANPRNPCPVALSSWHLQASPSGSWTLLLLAKPTFQEYISLSGNLWQKNSKSFSLSFSADNWIYHTFTGLLDYNIQAVTYWLLLCPPMDATNLSQLYYEKGWVTGNSLIPLPHPLSFPIKKAVLAIKYSNPFGWAHWHDGHLNNQS